MLYLLFTQNFMTNVQVQEMYERLRNKNKSKLLTQNKKLNTQIRILQKDLTQIMTIRQNQIMRNYQQTNSDLAKHRQQVAIQQKYIKKLKSKIDFLKSVNTKGNAQFIIKEEDDLLLVKKQYENLLIEKQVVSRFKDDKLKILDKDKPFEQYKKQIQDSLASVKKSNKTMQVQIAELQRQVRRFHNYNVLNSTLSRDKKQKSQLQFQIAKNEHQTKQTQQKTKQIQEKWKNQLETLDKQFLQLKSQFSKIQVKLIQVQKQHRMWQTRKNGLRNEEQIIQFRDRLSKVQLLPQQKQFENIKAEKQKKKQKAPVSQLLKASKTLTQQQKKINKQIKEQEKQQQVENIPEDLKKLQSRQLINKGKLGQGGSLRKSDKNIVNQQLKKQKVKNSKQQKTKHINIGQNLLLKQNKDKKDKLLLTPNKEQHKQHKEKQKQKQKPKQKEKSNKNQLSNGQKQKNNNKKQSISKKQVNQKNLNNKIAQISKNEIKSQKGVNKKQTKSNQKELKKQRSEQKLIKGTQMKLQSPFKKDKSKKEVKDQKTTQADISKSQKLSNSPQKSGKLTRHQQIKGYSTKKGEQIQSPKINKEGKKQKKLLLKSIGVGTS